MILILNRKSFFPVKLEHQRKSIFHLRKHVCRLFSTSVHVWNAVVWPFMWSGKPSHLLLIDVNLRTHFQLHCGFRPFVKYATLDASTKAKSLHAPVLFLDGWLVVGFCWSLWPKKKKLLLNSLESGLVNLLCCTLLVQCWEKEKKNLVNSEILGKQFVNSLSEDSEWKKNKH